MRSNNVFWGVLILLVGVLLLLNTAGWIPADLWVILWGGLLIALGLWFLLGPKVLRCKLSGESLAIPLEDATQAEVSFQYGAGKLELYGTDTPGVLLEGVFTGGVKHSRQRAGSGVHLHLQLPSPFILPPFFIPGWLCLESRFDAPGSFDAQARDRRRVA